jgi:hypothetical protein
LGLLLLEVEFRLVLIKLAMNDIMLLGVMENDTLPSVLLVLDSVAFIMDNSSIAPEHASHLFIWHDESDVLAIWEYKMVWAVCS